MNQKFVREEETKKILRLCLFRVTIFKIFKTLSSSLFIFELARALKKRY